jgi:phage tail sheath protein FI
MPTYLSPGVYVEEVDSGSRPIEGVGTAVAAFVGLAEDGPFNAPTLVPNWTEYVRNFGGFVEGSYLAQSVYAYFQNGGGNCYVVRIGQEGNGNGGRGARAITAGPQAMLGTYRVVAIDSGTAEGSISVDVYSVEGEGNEGLFKLVVRQGD